MSQKVTSRMLLEPKILTKIECCDCEAKFSPLNDLEELDPASVLVKNDLKTISGPSMVEIVNS